MISRQDALAFAESWVAAWNAHDMERILAHYTDDFVMASPLIMERMGVASGILRGKEAVRPYWQIGLEATPPLKFKLVEVFVGVESVVIYYHSFGRKQVSEQFYLNEAGKVYRAASHHGPAAQNA